jgi:putative membrane protein
MWWLNGYGAQNWWMPHVIGMTLFWVAVLVVFWLVAIRPRSVPPTANTDDANEAGILSARTILEERYARGEIGREEFLNKMRDLEAVAFCDETAAHAQE